MPDDDQYSPGETAPRMERGLRRALRTPPQPHGKNPKSLSPKRKSAPRIKGARSQGENAELVPIWGHLDFYPRSRGIR